MVKFTKNNLRTLEKRYLLKDNLENIIETPDEMLVRVANTVCGNNEILKSKILEMMNNLRFLPNTPTIMNAGTTNMLSACFCISMEDNLESIIHDAGWQQSWIHKLGGGVGLNFSSLRPRGDIIKTTGGITSGVIGFLEVFNVLSEIIRQGGKRDGANMALLDISHPEIEDWINAKTGKNKKKFRNFNLSIVITDKFMKYVNDDLDWELSFEGKVYKIIKAKYLYNLICKSAWESGCPGMIFIDEINRNNPYKDIMWIKDTNPCAEQPLYIGMYNGKKIAESCNLGSHNLSKYTFFDINNKEYKFNFDLFRSDIRISTEFLDLVIDVNKYPFSFIDEGTKLTRKIGLGITGLSESLIKLDITYGSKESLEFIEKVMQLLQNESHQRSYELGCEKGNYPLYEEHKVDFKYCRRNLFTTTIAPTGTIGRFMLGHPYSSGIEPPPAINMYSNIIDTTIDDGIHPLLIEMLKEKVDKKTLDIIIKKLNENGKSVQNIEEVPDRIKQLFLVAEEIPIETHIKIQSLVQRYTDNAVSKTINMNNSASIENISKAFTLAWESSCKGVTVYRNECKEVQVFNSKKSDTENISKEISFDLLKDFNVQDIEDLEERPEILPSLTFVKRTGCSTLFITPTKMWEKDAALEGFINKSSETGGCLGLQDGLAIAISVYNRYLEAINHQHAKNALRIVTHHLEKKTCRTSEMALERQKQKVRRGEKIGRKIDSTSCPNALAQCFKYMLEHDIQVLVDGKIPDMRIFAYDDDLNREIKESILTIEEDNTELKRCPECGSKTIRMEGCMNDTCIKCGFGGCS